MKDNLNAIENKILNDSSFEEATFCSFISDEGEKVLVGCIYRSPNSSEENFNNLIKLFDDDEISKFDKLLLMGDFNLPNVNWQGHNSSKREVSFVECLRDLFLEQVTKNPTRRRGNQKPTLDDLILVNDENLVSDISHFNPLGKSDHDVLVFKLYINIKVIENSTNEKFDIFRGNFDQMRKDMLSKDWSELEDLDVEDGWSLLKESITNCMNQNIPKIDPNKKVKSKPKWFNGVVKKSVKKKYLLYKRYLQSDASIDYHKYIEQRNICNRVIKRAKREYERKISQNCKENPKTFWQYVRSKSKCVSGISPLDKGDGNLAFDDKDKADILNKFFSGVFTRENTDNVPELEPGCRSNYTFLADIVISEEAVKKKLLNLNPYKAQGPDGIPNKVLKELSNELSKPIATLFNKSIQSGTVPL